MSALVGCEPRIDAQAGVRAQRLVTSDGTLRTYVETASVAVGPLEQAACPAGAVTTVYFEKVGRDTDHLKVVHRPLGATSVPTTSELAFNQAPLFPSDTIEVYSTTQQLGPLTVCWPPLVPSAIGLYNEAKQVDPVMVRAGGARVVLIAQNRYRLPAAAPPCNVARDVTESGQYGTAHHAYVSDDCGLSWRYATSMTWPYEQRIDRPELYADPFTTVAGGVFRRLYLGTRAWFGGGGDAGRRLMVSDDGGESWQAAADPSPETSSQPQVFTSVPPSTERPDGRLILGRCQSGTPQVTWSDDGGLTFAAWRDVRDPDPAATPAETDCAFYSNFTSYGACNVDADCPEPHQYCEVAKQRCRGTRLLHRIHQASTPISLARVIDNLPTDRVRFVYPSLVAEQQILRVVHVTVERQGAPGNYTSPVVTVARSTTVVPTNGYHAALASFIETDRFAFKPAATDPLADTALLHWLEDADIDSTGLGSARYAYRAVMNNTWSPVGYASGSLLASGVRDTALQIDSCTAYDASDPANEFCFVGDYNYGAFYYDPATSPSNPLHFIVQWTQDDPSTGGAELTPFYNTVRVGVRQ